MLRLHFSCSCMSPAPCVGAQEVLSSQKPQPLTLGAGSKDLHWCFAEPRESPRGAGLRLALVVFWGEDQQSRLSMVHACSFGFPSPELGNLQILEAAWLHSLPSLALRVGCGDSPLWRYTMFWTATPMPPPIRLPASASFAGLHRSADTLMRLFLSRKASALCS